MTRPFLLGILPAALLLGCATTGGNPAPEYSPTGEVQFSGNSASFDAHFVRGPRINLSRRSDDGSWAGQLQDAIVDVSVSPNRLSGVNLVLTQETTANGVVITGQYQGKILRYEVNTEQFIIRTPTRSLTLLKKGDGLYGPDGQLKLTGEAALANPPWPQFALSLVGAF